MNNTTHGPTHGHRGHGPHGLDGFYAALRRTGIVRTSDGRWFAGVAAGIARWLGVDPLVVRAAFILFALFFGMGFAVYLVFWLLMPDERGRLSIEQALKHGDGGSIFLLVITVISVLGGAPWWDGDMHGFRIGGFVVLAVLAWWFLTRTDAGRDLSRSAPWRNRVPGAPGGAPPAQSGATDQEGAAGPFGSTAPTSPGDDAFATGRGVAGSSAGLSTGNAAANAGVLPYPSARVVVPPRPRARTIGFAAGLLVLGASLVTTAAVSELGRVGSWPGSHIAIGIAAGLGVLGLGLLISGLVGRRAGWLAPFAVLGIVAAVFTSVIPSGLTEPWRAGQAVERVTTLTGDNAYQLGMGELRVDLTGAKYAQTPGVDRISATVGMGQLDVVLPEGVRVTVHAKARAGELLALDSNEQAVRLMGTDSPGQHHQSGTGWEETVTFGSGPEQMVVDAEVGLGQIRITTGSAS